MDRQQFELARDIVNEDCESQGRLRTVAPDGTASFCALGGLMAAIDPDWAMTGYYDGTASEVIAEVFDLTFQELALIFQANDKDSWATPESVVERRRRVVAQLEQFVRD